MDGDTKMTILIEDPPQTIHVIFEKGMFAGLFYDKESVNRHCKARAKFAPSAIVYQRKNNRISLTPEEYKELCDSRRERIATAAMQGILAQSVLDTRDQHYRFDDDGTMTLVHGHIPIPKNVAASAILYADALLAELYPEK